MPLNHDATNRTFHKTMRHDRPTQEANAKAAPFSTPRRYKGTLTGLSPPGDLGDAIMYELILRGYRVHASMEVQLDIAHGAIIMVGRHATAAYDRAVAAGKILTPGTRVVVTLQHWAGSAKNPTIATLEPADGDDRLRTGAAQLV